MKTFPKLESAAVTAREISKILKEDGFRKADTSNHFRWTEGYHVSCLGSSRTVNVDYHIPRKEDQHGTMKRLKIAQMRETLFELGYQSSHPHAIYIECLKP